MRQEQILFLSSGVSLFFFCFFPVLVFCLFYTLHRSRASTTATPPSRSPHREKNNRLPTLKTFPSYSAAHLALNRMCHWPAEQQDSYVSNHSRSSLLSMCALQRKMTVLGLRHCVGALKGFPRAALSSRGGDLPPLLEPP